MFYEKLSLLIFYMFLSFSHVSFAEEEKANAPGAVPTPAADTVSVSLTVRAKGNGKLVKRAEVKIATDVFYTDKDGKVTLAIPAAGDGKVLVSRFGFEKVFLEFSDLRATPALDVFLYPGAPSDNEVFVRGEKRPEVSKKTISVEESKRVAPNDDPAQVVQLMPGVQSSSFGTDVAIRGSGPEDSKYFIDNFMVTNIFHAIDDLSIMPDQLISDVEFYSGGFGAQYGGVTGGIIVLRTKTDIPEDPKTHYKINLPFYSGIYHERPLSENSMLAVSFRYSYLQYLLPSLIPEDSGFTVVPYFDDVHAFYLLKDGQGGHTKILALGAQDGIKAVFNSGESTSDDGRDSVNFYRGFASVGVEKLSTYGEGWSTLTTPQVFYDKFRASFFSDTVDWDYYQARVHWEATKRLSKKEAFYFGVEPNYGLFYADINAPVESNDPLFDSEDAERVELQRKIPFVTGAAWTSIDRQVGPFVFTPGLRYFYDYQIKKFGVDPRLASRFEIDGANTLKAAVGLYSSSPTPYESNDVFGNEDLAFEKSIHYVLGWESRWADRWETDLQVYYKTLYDLVVPSSEETFENTGRGRSRGAELFVRRNLTDQAFGWLSYTYSRTETRETIDDGWKASDFDQTHVAQLVGSYNLTATWDLGSRIKYHTGDTYEPVDDAVYNASLDKYQPRSDGSKKRLPDYHKIDLFATKDFLMDTSKMALRLGLSYLSFTEQVYSRGNNYDYSEEEDFHFIRMFPFIELKGEL